jgi:hypothetical protein
MMMETVTGLQGKPVDVVVDPAERAARGLPEKIDSTEYHFGTEATYLSAAETKISDLKAEAVALAKRAAAAEFGVDYDRAAAGLKFIELKAAVQAEGHGWEDWFPKHVRGVTIRTAQRYMALARAPERAPARATADQPSEPNDTVSSPAEVKETLKKVPEGSPRRRLAAIVAKLSESEAGELLTVVEKWRAKRA